MRRLVTTVLLLAVLVLVGCAKRPVTASATSAEAPAPFTNRELIDELRRQGVGTATTGASGAAAVGTGVSSRSGATASASAATDHSVPEITETPRGVVITLPHTYFAFDSFDLDPQARRVVDRIAHVLNDPRAASRSIVLEGHADAVGTEAYNLALSRRRAESIARELIGLGVLRERVSVEAYGESRPVAPNTNTDGTDSPAGRAKNRRVEAVIRQ
jgi:outer membrane protein OmpA-like peptidoglycan-associated protein